MANVGSGMCGHVLPTMPRGASRVGPFPRPKSGLSHHHRTSGQGCPVNVHGQHTAVGLPVGLSINADSGVISGTPTVRQRTHVTVTASDTYNSASNRFRWIVKPAPTPGPGRRRAPVGPPTRMVAFSSPVLRAL
jgi:hypothetical protein